MTDPKTDPPKVAPEDDIGPFYRYLGGLLAVAGVCLFLVHAYNRQTISWIDFATLCVIALLVLAMIRPRFFDSTVKTIADKLPMFSYKKE